MPFICQFVYFLFVLLFVVDCLYLFVVGYFLISDQAWCHCSVYGYTQKRPFLMEWCVRVCVCVCVCVSSGSALKCRHCVPSRPGTGCTVTTETCSSSMDACVAARFLFSPCTSYPMSVCVCVCVSQSSEWAVLISSDTWFLSARGTEIIPLCINMHPLPK